MRCTLFAGVCVMMTLISSGVLAQTQKGAMLIGTSLGGASYGSDTATLSTSADSLFLSDEVETSSYSIFVSPRVGWFVKDDLAVGSAARIAYTHAKADRNDGGIGTRTSTGTAQSYFVEPFVRYYFKGNVSAKPFIEANASFAFEPTRSKSGSSEFRTTPKGSYGAGLIVGYEHFINKTAGVVVSSGVSYSYRKTENEFKARTGFGDITQTTTEITKAWTVPLTVGLEIHL